MNSRLWKNAAFNNLHGIFCKLRKEWYIWLILPTALCLRIKEEKLLYQLQIIAFCFALFRNCLAMLTSAPWENNHTPLNLHQIQFSLSALPESTYLQPTKQLTKYKLRSETYLKGQRIQTSPLQPFLFCIAILICIKRFGTLPRGTFSKEKLCSIRFFVGGIKLMRDYSQV